MGNCIDVPRLMPEEKIGDLICNGGEKEFIASTPVEQMTDGPFHGFKLVHHAQPCSPLAPSMTLQPGDLCRLVPFNPQPYGTPVTPGTAKQETGQRRRVKILVTKQQLELLLRSTKKLQYRDIVGQFQGGSRVKGTQLGRKWLPSLSTIPEAQSF